MIRWIKQLTNPPSAHDMLVRDLEAAQRMRLDHLKSAEEHSAWVGMLDKRISRIRSELEQTRIPQTNELTVEIAP